MLDTAGEAGDELIRDILLWTSTHGRAKAGRPARTYIQQLCEDTGCCPEDLPRAVNDRDGVAREGQDIRATSTIWWWWWSLSSKRSISFVFLSWRSLYVIILLTVSCKKQVLELFALCLLCEWNQISLGKILKRKKLFLLYSFDDSTNSQNPWSCGSNLPKFSEFSQLQIRYVREVWLVVWVFCYINLYCLFIYKSIFMLIISSISNNSV